MGQHKEVNYGGDDDDCDQDGGGYDHSSDNGGGVDGEDSGSDDGGEGDSEKDGDYGGDDRDGGEHNDGDEEGGDDSCDEERDRDDDDAGDECAGFPFSYLHFYCLPFSSFPVLLVSALCGLYQPGFHALWLPVWSMQQKLLRRIQSARRQFGDSFLCPSQ